MNADRPFSIMRWKRMLHDLPLLIDRIRALLERRAADPGRPFIREMEHTLTDGYALALALESERSRIEKRMGELAHHVEHSHQAYELRGLAARLREADDELTRLRGLLSSLRRRADEVKSMAADPAAR